MYGTRDQFTFLQGLNSTDSGHDELQLMTNFIEHLEQANHVSMDSNKTMVPG